MDSKYICIKETSYDSLLQRVYSTLMYLLENISILGYTIGGTHEYNTFECDRAVIELEQGYYKKNN
jgi:hypothetical protein